MGKERKTKVFYRQNFEGTLTFGGKKLCADYDLIYAYYVDDPYQNLYLTIYQDTEIYWEGYFTPSMGEWDFDAKTFTVTPLSLMIIQTGKPRAIRSLIFSR